MSKKSKLVLASASPNRLELLKNIDLEPDEVSPSDIDETPVKGEHPREYVIRIAQEKGLAAQKKHKDAFIIAADTIAAIGTDIIGKADSDDEARTIISRFSGRRHRVYSGVCVINPDGKVNTKAVLTYVKFTQITDKDLDEYIASGEWKGKSGCFGIQGRGGGFIQSINGSFSNVVGLPLVEVKNMLRGLGYK